MITTDIIINENRVLKDVSIDFQNKEFSFRVFGKHMEVESLGGKPLWAPGHPSNPTHNHI